MQDDPAPEEPLRAILEQWLAQFANDDFGEKVSGTGTGVWAAAVSYDTTAEYIDLLVGRLRKVLSEIRSI